MGHLGPIRRIVRVGSRPPFQEKRPKELTVLKPRVVRHVSFAPLLRPAKLGHEARARFEVHAHKLAVAPGVVVFRVAPGNKFADIDFMREQGGEEEVEMEEDE